jgi:protein-tyrosine phosphatase
MRKLLPTVLVFLLAAFPAVAERPSKIAFVDTGNTGRSLTAEAIANQIIEEKHLNALVISRAVDVDPFEVRPEAFAAELLKQRGLDVSHHRAQQLTAQDVKHADVIVTMTAKHRDAVIALYPEARDKVFTIAEYATGKPGEVADAYGKPMAVYETMVKQVGDFVPLVLEKAPHKPN